MKTRYLTILTTLAFLGFAVPAVAHDCARHSDPNHKHCSGGGGTADPTFDVSFDGDMAGSGTDWIQPNNSAKNIRYFFHDHEHIGTGEIGLSYFQAHDFPFDSDRGEKCFGTDLSTQVVQGDITQTKSGAAVVSILFMGTTEDGLIELGYFLKLEGTFKELDDWTPQLMNTVILTSWNLRVASKS